MVTTGIIFSLYRFWVFCGQENICTVSASLHLAFVQRWASALVNLAFVINWSCTYVEMED